MWPPPAPPEYIDRTQLPASLRAPSLASQQRGEDERNDRDDVSDAAGTPLTRRHSSASEAGPASTAADHSETSHGRREFHRGTETADSPMTRPQSDVARDRQPEPTCDRQSDTTHERPSEPTSSRQSDVTHERPSEPTCDRPLDVSRDREASHQLKRSSAVDHEPGMQAKRQSDGVVYEGTWPARSAISGPAGMDVDRRGEAEYGARSGHLHGSEVDESGIGRGGPDTPGTASRPLPESVGGAEGQVRAVPPRLMETGASNEPMLIEFSTAGGPGGAGSEDDVSVRAGHKRACVNSDTVHNDVVKKSFVKRPVTFYGNCASFLLRTAPSSEIYSRLCQRKQPKSL